MPGGDGRGPLGGGPAGGGRGMGGGNRAGAGPGGQCVCPGCRHKVTHSPGVPCYTLKCPRCGSKMVRG